MTVVDSSRYQVESFVMPGHKSSDDDHGSDLMLKVSFSLGKRYHPIPEISVFEMSMRYAIISNGTIKESAAEDFCSHTATINLSVRNL